MNSYAHIFGNKPYDKFIKPTDSYTVSLLAFGEGKKKKIFYGDFIQRIFTQAGIIIITRFHMIIKPANTTNIGATILLGF